MIIDNPTVIATHDFSWQKKPGEDVIIQVMVGAPYRREFDWACPCAIFGLDGRYPDVVAVSSIQALSLAMHLLRDRIKGMVEQGEILDLLVDWSYLRPESVDVLFGI